MISIVLCPLLAPAIAGIAIYINLLMAPRVDKVPPPVVNCPTCGYLLEGLSERGVCPECGQWFDCKRPAVARVPRRTGNRIVSVLPLVLTAAIALPIMGFKIVPSAIAACLVALVASVVLAVMMLTIETKVGRGHHAALAVGLSLGPVAAIISGVVIQGGDIALPMIAGLPLVSLSGFAAAHVGHMLLARR